MVMDHSHTIREARDSYRKFKRKELQAGLMEKFVRRYPEEEDEGSMLYQYAIRRAEVTAQEVFPPLKEPWKVHR